MRLIVDSVEKISVSSGSVSAEFSSFMRTWSTGAVKERMEGKEMEGKEGQKGEVELHEDLKKK